MFCCPPEKSGGFFYATTLRKSLYIDVGSTCIQTIYYFSARNFMQEPVYTLYLKPKTLNWYSGKMAVMESARNMGLHDVYVGSMGGGSLKVHKADMRFIKHIVNDERFSFQGFYEMNESLYELPFPN